MCRCAMALRSEVLRCYKTLLRSSQNVFKDDSKFLERAREEIRNGFVKNRDVTNPAEVTKLVKFGEEVKTELEQSVFRVEKNEATGRYGLKVEERHLRDNPPFPPPPRTGRNSQPLPSGCCGGYCR